MLNENFLKGIRNSIQNEYFQFKVANACSKAFAEEVGQPEMHSDFTYEDKQMIAQNLVGLLALNAGISIISLIRLGCTQKPEKVLDDIAYGYISDEEKEILLRLAYLSWISQQPVERINVFDLLSKEEREKFLIQIKTAAKELKMDRESWKIALSETYSDRNL